MKDLEFVFSVVIAVYNTEDYLEEAFESLRNQSIGFDRIQIILVDDGSTDRSGRICDSFAEEYPKNVISLHKENGGQSSARNLGMEYATGRYINFMDADDRISADAFERVVSFFAVHEQETDVAAIPIRFFEAVEGEYWQNNKFEQGDRVIDLQKDFAFLQASASNAFFVRERVKDIRFKEGLGYAEDTRYSMTCLAGQQTIGLVGKCWYEYRKRRKGNSSTQQLSNHPFWKTWWMEQYEFWAVRYFQNTCGYVPRWVQYALLCHLGGRVYEEAMIGESEEDPEYTEKIKSIVSQIEPAVYNEISVIDSDCLRLLQHLIIDKNKTECQGTDAGNNTEHEELCPVKSVPVRLNQVSAAENVAELKGIVYLYQGMDRDGLSIRPSSGSEKGILGLERFEAEDTTWNGYIMRFAYRFCFSAFLNQREPEDLLFSYGREEKGEYISARIIAGDYIPTLPLPRSTGRAGEWKYIVSASKIRFIPCGSFASRVKRETGWLVTLIQKKQMRAFFQRIQYYFMKLLGATPAWIRNSKGLKMEQLNQVARYNADLIRE